MAVLKKGLSRTFRAFFDSEKAAGGMLIACTLLSMVAANSAVGVEYVGFWHTKVGPLSIENWVNDALMAVFLLLIGLELEREFYSGELSSAKTALLPIIAAAGGVIVPAAIHFSLNAGTLTQGGAGIPMATDIAFSLGALTLVGNRVPSSLKVFLVAFAVIDDLIAIIVIAVFYTAGFSIVYFAAALGVWCILVILNKVFRVMLIAPYAIGGAVMWVLMYTSGVHATIAGVLLALAIPFSAKQDDMASPSHRLEHLLHRPVAFVILPIFALANTAIGLNANWAEGLLTANSLGIMLGLIFGKPFGILGASLLAVGIGLCRLPDDVGWKHLAGVGMLGGIGFTMSIFITNLAFGANSQLVDASKVAVLAASLIAGAAGCIWLKAGSK